MKFFFYPFAEILGLVREEESLFSYPRGKTRYDFLRPNFIPAFINEAVDEELEQTDPEFVAQVRETCGGSATCLFDAVVTRNVEVAVVTKETESTQDNLRNISRPGEPRLVQDE